MTPTIEATQNSLKLSYLRFISDSAPGLLLVLGILLLDQNVKLPIIIVPSDGALKAVAAVIVFLLATPLGLMINGISHFMIGGMQHWIAGRCLSSYAWPIANTHDILLVSRWKTYFDVTDDTWPGVAYEIDDLFETYMPHLAAVLDHIRALKKFCRSFALLLLTAILVVAGAAGVAAAVFLVMAILVALLPKTKKYHLLFILIAAGVTFYGCWPDHIALAGNLFAAAIAAALFAGLVEFYQYGSVMLFLYQLFSKSDEPGVKLSAESVRERLQKVGADLRASPSSPSR